jgi:hypothetical protein
MIRLTQSQAAVQLGISVRTLQRRIRKGQIKTEHGPLTPFGRPGVFVLLEDKEPSASVTREVTHPEVPLFPEVALCPEPKTDEVPSENFDPSTFRDSFGNGLHEPNPAFLAAFRPMQDGPDACVPAIEPIRSVVPRILFDVAPSLGSGYGLTQEQLDEYCRTHPRRQKFYSF